jgi:cytidylate kinase
LAKAIAKELGYIYIDTGAMYRAVTLYALQNRYISGKHFDKSGLISQLDNIEITFKFNTRTGKSETFLNGKNVEKEIREMEVSRFVSRIAEVPEIRRKLVELQQRIARQKGVVMDGRDIGSVVMPEAELKIFMTASPEIRARRRWKELTEKGIQTSYEEVLHNVTERDRIDSNRKASPLIRTEDAILLDNSHLSPEEQLQYVLRHIKEIIANKTG